MCQWKIHLVKHKLGLLVCLLALGARCFGWERGQIQIIEAEQCLVTPGHAAPKGFPWASGEGQVHEFWGEQPNDTVRFDLTLASDEPALKVGVRYSYNMRHYLGMRGRPVSVEGIVLAVDGGGPVKLTMPDTGDWHIYRLLEVPLPPLRKGTHHFALRSTAAGAVRNIDCFVFYTGAMDGVAAWLRGSVAYRDPSGRFWVLTSPGLEVGSRVQAFIGTVSRAWKFYADYYGHEAPKPLRLHLIPNNKWDNPGATAYQNNAGLFFPESSFDKDTGNILHELTHWFNMGRLPGWFDEPTVHALTCFVWFPELQPWDDPVLRQRTVQGKQAVQSVTTPLPSVEDVLSVLFVEHGRDLFRKFWHGVHEAERQGKLAAGKALSRDELVQYLSRAAGKDVRPVFQRWPGFAHAR
jgi:hypothetical protein